MTDVPRTCLVLHSTIDKSGTLEIELKEQPVPEPGDDEVVIRVQATPINPSDLGLLIGPADVNSAKKVGGSNAPKVKMKVPKDRLPLVQGRLGQSLPVGNEGAGTVVAAGKNAQDLMGKLVAGAGGAMYAEYRCIPTMTCLPMPDGTDPADAAASFVNPLTVLAMLETMRMENHSAIINTAAASNLGRMLIKVCAEDDVPLISVVRREEHVKELQKLGAQYVCDSSAKDFEQQLTEAIKSTGATLAFDATGGGVLADQILGAMERAAIENAGEYSRYGSDTYKQVYIYGGLDRRPTELKRTYGMSWGLGGWLLTPMIGRMGMERFNELRQRVAANISSLFASHYTAEISLADALEPDNIRAYAKQATGEKYLITPSK